MITSGKSSDLVEDKAQVLQDAGVTVFAVGMYGHGIIELFELKETFKDPLVQLPYNEQRYSQLHYRHAKLPNTVCTNT